MQPKNEDLDSNCDQIGEELLENKDKQINSSDHKVAVRQDRKPAVAFSYQIFPRLKCNLLQAISKRSRLNAASGGIDSARSPRQGDVRSSLTNVLGGFNTESQQSRKLGLEMFQFSEQEVLDTLEGLLDICADL